MHLTLDQVKAIIEGQPLVLSQENRNWQLKFDRQSEYGFSGLGAGTGKHVFRIRKGQENLDWVFCFPAWPNSRNAQRDIKQEVEILERLGKEGVVVPIPFQDGKVGAADIVGFTLSNTDSGFHGETSGFFLEYLDLRGRYVEMPKKGADKEARGKWLQEVIERYKPGSTKHLHATRRTFSKIRNAWDIKKWGDFQVLYDRSTGELVVIDPNNETTSAKDTEYILEKWEEDLKEMCEHCS